MLAFGGHADLPRTLEYLCTGIQPDGATRPPHDYGLAIVLLSRRRPRRLRRQQVAPLRQAIRSFLEASRLDMVDKAKSAQEFERAKTLALSLDGTVADLHGLRERTRRRAAGPRAAAAHGGSSAADPALSPARSPLPSAPVFLLHGTDDNVVPAIESTLLGRHAAASGLRARVLLTPLITHAEVDRGSTMGAIWRLIDFWTDVLDE